MHLVVHRLFILGELVACAEKGAPVRKQASKPRGLIEEDGIAFRPAASHDHATPAPSDIRGVSPQIPRWGCFAAERRPQALRRREIAAPQHGPARAFHPTPTTLGRSAAPRGAARGAL